MTSPRFRPFSGALVRAVAQALARVLSTLLAAAGVDVSAQTMPYDHVHLAVADPARAVEWYLRNLGGQKSPRPDRVAFDQTLVIFQRAENRLPSAGGAVDHIGFSVANVDDTLRELERGGARVLTPATDVPGVFRAGFVEDPWGVKIEIMQDPEARGFTHIHLTSDAPDDTLSWYARMFGGERTRHKGLVDAVRYGAVWLMAQPGTAAAGERRAVDHLSWRVPNVDAATATLKASGVQVLSEPGLSPGGNRVSFVEGPAGVRIEMMQRPQ